MRLSVVVKSPKVDSVKYELLPGVHFFKNWYIVRDTLSFSRCKLQNSKFAI